MNTLLWVFQVFLAVTFVYSGIMKSTSNREKLVRIGQTGIANFSYPAIRSIGILEILGAFGILLPWRLQILPVLTPISSVCFAAIMIPAAGIHMRRKEFKSLSFNILLFGISVFVAFKRFPVH
ncbi:MAG TPA: DoxX family protein [Puia sp.]|jgi:uncharacterized membrane protein YphA (DoxX/SURF4 family)